MAFLGGLRRRFSSASSVETWQRENVTLFQAFEWYVPADQRHWKRLSAVLEELKAIGIHNVWIPPGCKASGPQSNGYDVYDLYDIGEFDWKMSKSTKWGDREDLEKLGARAQELGIGLYWDAVLNHKAAADRQEACQAVAVDPRNRLKEVGAPQEIDAWVCFDFPARGDRYSSMKYTSNHFTGTDYNARSRQKTIFRFVGERRGWAKDVDTENGNYDYLMFSDLDYNNPDVVADVNSWGKWIGDQVTLKGMRLDAIRHISEAFLRQFIHHVRKAHGQGQFFIGEYWKDDLPSLRGYLSRMEHCLSLFDAPLVHNFARASRTPNFDLRTIFTGSLVSVEPRYAVTLVMNHDTQPTQAMAEGAAVAPRFSNIAHALILLRKAGTPCTFYGTLYGTKGPKPSAADTVVADMCLARKLYAYGRQRDYIGSANCISWTREGHGERSDGSGLAVLVANYEPAKTNARGRSRTQVQDGRMHAKMKVGKAHAGETWTDLVQCDGGEVKIDAHGWSSFSCPQYGVAVWVSKDAPGRELFGKFDTDIYGRDI